jgi:CheY-like chemotaxis protein
VHVQHEAPAGRGLTPGQAPAQILVVDDERVVRAFASRVLREAGYRVREASDGVEAWELASREGAELDAVLSDVVMPRLTGVELLHRLAEVRPQLPVVLISGYGTEELNLRGISAPCGLLLKPFSRERLLDEIQRCLATRA